MKALVVYDSVFGNTEQIGRAIGAALGSGNEIRTLRVQEAGPEQLAGLGMLIVGSPTRAFRPTDAVKKFLRNIPGKHLRGVKVAAFDTRIAVQDIRSSALRFLVNVAGYAAKPIAGQLRKKGGSLVAPPEGFLVQGEKGPLKEGELERASAWAKRLLET